MSNNWTKKYSQNKKYEINGEGRIVALRDFGSVKAGDIGGYVESESNLSHEGNCWISDDARVSGNALVSDDAEVSDDAIVSGNARVSGNAKLTTGTYTEGEITE